MFNLLLLHASLLVLGAATALSGRVRQQTAFLSSQNRGNPRRAEAASSLGNSVAVVLPPGNKRREKSRRPSFVSPPSFSRLFFFSLSCSARRRKYRAHNAERDLIRSKSSTRKITEQQHGDTTQRRNDGSDGDGEQRPKKTLSTLTSPPTRSSCGALSALPPQAVEARRRGRESAALRGRRKGGEAARRRRRRRRETPVAVENIFFACHGQWQSSREKKRLASSSLFSASIPLVFF